jgi:hypothetical protein
MIDQICWMWSIDPTGTVLVGVACVAAAVTMVAIIAALTT